MAMNILGLVMDVMTQLPSLIKDGSEAVQLIESTLGTVRAAQAQGRDPTQAEWDAIHSMIDGLTGRLDAPEVPSGAAPTPVTPATDAEASVNPAEASAPVPVSDAGASGAPAATADAPPPASDTVPTDGGSPSQWARYNADDAKARADLADFEAKAKRDFEIE